MSPIQVAERYTYVVRASPTGFVATVVEFAEVEATGVTQELALAAARARVTDEIASRQFDWEALPEVWRPEPPSDVEALREELRRIRGDLVMLDALLANLPQQSRLMRTARLICRQGLKQG